MKRDVYVWNYCTIDQVLLFWRLLYSCLSNVTMKAMNTAQILQYWTIILYLLNVITLHVKKTQKLSPYFIVLQLLPLEAPPISLGFVPSSSVWWSSRAGNDNCLSLPLLLLSQPSVSTSSPFSLVFHCPLQLCTAQRCPSVATHTHTHTHS